MIRSLVTDFRNTISTVRDECLVTLLLIQLVFTRNSHILMIVRLIPLSFSTFVFNNSRSVHQRMVANFVICIF